MKRKRLRVPLGLDMREALIYVVLRRIAMHNGHVYSTLSFLAAKTRMTRREVVLVLQSLISFDVLKLPTHRSIL